MRKGRARLVRFPGIDNKNPKYEQVSRHLREMILSGAISAGSRLPAQRILARDLKVSRNTVMAAYDALMSEGFLTGRRGAGTYVVDRPVQRHVVVKRPRDVDRLLPLHQGVPAVDLFPVNDWRRVQDRVWRRITSDALGYGHPAGWSGLRHILAQRLAATRGVRCSAEQVHIVPTALAGIRLTCLALGMLGRKVWVETPGFGRAAAAFASAGRRRSQFQWMSPAPTLNRV